MSIKTGTIAALILFIFTFAACTSDKGETASGLQYEYIKKGKEKTKDGQYLVINVDLLTATDSIIFSSRKFNQPQVIIHQDSAFWEPGGVEEAFNLLNMGDSVRFYIPAKRVYEGEMYPPNVKADDMLTLIAGVILVTDQEGLVEWEQQWIESRQREIDAINEIQLAADVQFLEEYLKSQNINALKSPDGIFYVETEPGTGPFPQVGDLVSVHYVGKLLDGTIFDTSIESIARESGKYMEGRTYGPFQVVVGRGEVIKGWDKGILLFNEGAKGTLYIPSPLGYGGRQVSDEIKENSILVFDIEIVSVN
jgi:FKBP-type peptidyl-prolyl cis-trans isomerase FkpA